MDKGSQEPSFSRQVTADLQRKLKARADPIRVVPFGLGMMGVIGWSITVPTLLGAMLGLWIDRHRPGGHSWTLALLAAGLTLGCWTAWRWVAREMTTLQGGDQNEPK
ncbi:MAG TPA: AtpZ/AtpI family protein [Steroidobacteraceae bacterium]|nr:AtpZ/AtpI family protein [Steroidobacteraceae bacterium]